MTADLTPVGSAAVRLADALVRTKKQRDRARDLACAYEAQLAKVHGEDVASEILAVVEAHQKAVCTLDDKCRCQCGEPMPVCKPNSYRSHRAAMVGAYLADLLDVPDD